MALKNLFGGVLSCDMEKNHIHQCKHNSKLQNSKFTAFQKDYYYAFASSLVAVFCLASGIFDASIFVVPLDLHQTGTILAYATFHYFGFSEGSSPYYSVSSSSSALYCCLNLQPRAKISLSVREEDSVTLTSKSTLP